MLASRSGETVELKSIAVSVAHSSSPCLPRGICLSLSHVVPLLVYEQARRCHLAAATGTIWREK